MNLMGRYLTIRHHHLNTASCTGRHEVGLLNILQATANLPESGVVTSDTWQALLGPSAKPIDAKNLAMDNETDEDMTAEHAVYLVGEQRWSRRPSP